MYWASCGLVGLGGGGPDSAASLAMAFLLALRPLDRCQDRGCQRVALLGPLRLATFWNTLCHFIPKPLESTFSAVVHFHTAMSCSEVF